MPLDQLIHRYVEDRSSLSVVELAALIEALHAAPKRAVQLREQLLLDDMLSQKLAIDRQNFLAQVHQRIADFERGEEELDRQVAELRALAEAEIERPPAWSGSSPLVAIVVAAVAVAILIAVLVAPRLIPQEPQFIAKVAAVQGDVAVEAGPLRHIAAKGETLLAGHTLHVAPGAGVTIAYEDATSVHVGGDSEVTFDLDSGTAAKRIRIERGRVEAQVQPQSIGMRFQSPQAVATVLGTELHMTVTGTATRLDVRNGRVQFDRLADGRSLVVRGGETVEASTGMLAVRQLAWPDDRSNVAYLYSPYELLEQDQPLMVARNPATGNLRETLLTPYGSAMVLRPDMHLELSGGYLASDEAGADLIAICTGKSELTLELIFTPADPSQAGGRLVGFADSELAANFRLSQETDGYRFLLFTDERLEPLTLDIPVSPKRRRLHLAVTYRNGELTGYLDGAPVARRTSEAGSLRAWRPGRFTVGADEAGRNTWRGVVEGLALYSVALSPADVSQNARNFGVLSGRSEP